MAQHDHDPGQLPEIHDEAGDTPLWVPALGVALLCALAVTLALRAAAPDPADTPTAEVAEQSEEAEAAPTDQGAEQAAVAPPAPGALPNPLPTPTAAVQGDTDSFGRAADHEHFGHDHP